MILLVTACNVFDIRCSIKTNRRAGEKTVFFVSSVVFLHTYLSKIILDAAPGVFRDERLDQTPRLLLVFHVGVDPGGTAAVNEGCCLKLKSRVGAATAEAAHLSRHFRLDVCMM